MNTNASSLRSDHNQHAAFSLTELLTVLATLALLAFLILPVLARSSDQGARTVCANNLRKLGRAMLMYGSDNRDYMAYPNWDTVYPGWLFKPEYGSIPRFPSYSDGLWFEYVKNPNSYRCPVDTESAYYRARANQLSSYVINGAVCGYGRYASTGCRITDVWSPECYLLWTPDENVGSPPIGPFAYNDGSSYPDTKEGIARLHSLASADILTVGGSVQMVSAQKVATEQTSTRRSLVWWSPASTNGR